MISTDQIVHEAAAIRNRLARTDRLGKWIDARRPIPAPWRGTDHIRLVVVGQDPTVQNERSRDGITTVLNLDKPGALQRHVTRIASGLGLGLANVYATNLCKHFFTEPPTAILADHGIDVLTECASECVALLRRELQEFPDAAIISLGQPVLPVLVTSGPREVREYWGYEVAWRKNVVRPFSWVGNEASVFGRAFFPFVHQPSLRGNRGQFYEHRFNDCLAHLRTRIEPRRSQKSQPDE